ncbi:MAG: chloride channel protein, partial [Pseudomonadales bacterium]|nr:chloride channel protein [Pseudomonadales bacterium]
LFRRRLASMDALPQLTVLGLFSGAITASIILLFRYLIETPLTMLLPDGDPEGFESLSTAMHFILPVSGGLVAAILLYLMGVNDRKVGVAYVMERLANHQGYITLKSAAVQFVTGILSLVSGQSAGREGPAVHLGSACGSLLGQFMRLPNNSIRTLVACGTAAAISASFNTPIAGVIFAMEVVMMEFTIASFSPVIIASVTAAIITQTVYGNTPAFVVPQLSLDSLSDIPLILLLACVIAVASAFFVNTLQFFMRFKQHSILLRVSVAGLLTGMAAVIFPEIMGIGYDTVNQTILGEIAIGSLLVIAFVKLLITSMAVGLGMPSGLIGPLLFIGAGIGGAFGLVGQYFWPDTTTSPGFFAMLGMGAMMGCALQAPLAALLALLELTLNPHILLPGILVIVVSSLIASEIMNQKSVFLTILREQGLNYQTDPVIQALRRVSVGAIMERSIKRANKLITYTEAQDLLKSEPRWIIVESDRTPLSALPAADLVRFLGDAQNQPEPKTETADNTTEIDKKPDKSIDLMAIPAQRKDLQSLYFQATLQEALDRFDDSGAELLYVERVSAPTIKTILGVLSRQDIENYYQYKRR